MGGAGIMEVVLESAKDLKKVDFFGKVDPFVVLQYRDEVHVSKPAQGQGNNPTWNEEFKFMVEYPITAEKEYNLILQIYDHDFFNGDDYLGQTIIDVEELFDEGVKKGRDDLGVQKYRVVLADHTYYGEIKVGVSFTLNLKE